MKSPIKELGDREVALHAKIGAIITKTEDNSFLNILVKSYSGTPYQYVEILRAVCEPILASLKQLYEYGYLFQDLDIENTDKAVDEIIKRLQLDENGKFLAKVENIFSKVISITNKKESWYSALNNVNAQAIDGAKTCVFVTNVRRELASFLATQGVNSNNTTPREYLSNLLTDVTRFLTNMKLSLSSIWKLLDEQQQKTQLKAILDRIDIVIGNSHGFLPVNYGSLLNTPTIKNNLYSQSSEESSSGLFSNNQSGNLPEKVKSQQKVKGKSTKASRRLNFDSQRFMGGVKTKLGISSENPKSKVITLTG